MAVCYDQMMQKSLTAIQTCLCKHFTIRLYIYINIVCRYMSEKI